MYFKTYGEFKEIIPAPTWLMLEDFGGLLNIVDFRKLFEYNNKDYLVLHPPLITRQLQIEESYKKSNNNNMMANKLENIYDGELVLKRNKPIESNNFNLENIIFYSLDNNIKQYDISLLEFGGCSLTIKNSNLHQNLSYQLFFNIIQKYINLINL